MRPPGAKKMLYSDLAGGRIKVVRAAAFTPRLVRETERVISL